MPDTIKQTVIEAGTEFDGCIKSECPITLSGSVKGQVTAPSLTVNPTGTVSGKVKVGELTSRGEISGEVEAETVELSGRVSDETVIRARTLEVKLSQPTGGLQVAFGNCQLDVGDLPARQKAQTTGKASTETGKKSHREAQAAQQPAEPGVEEAIAELLK